MDRVSQGMGSRLRAAALAAVAAFAALALGACGNDAHYPINPPLAQYDPLGGYRLENIAHDHGNSRELVVVLMISGGGTRAAALAYGALEALRDSRVIVARKPSTLLSEVDFITAVSGGSVTAAYFGLYGDRLFTEFPDRFLYRDVEGELRGALWRNLLRLRSDRFGRADLLDEYLSEHVFSDATYADMAKRPRPFVVINATDLSLGAQFAFTQTYFDLMCSDLSAVKVSRAVAASAALPLYFSPVTLRNYGGSCGYAPPAWFTAEPSDPRIKHELDGMRTYTDAKRRPHIHLLDGGLLDNLALRQAMATVYRHGGFAATLDTIGYSAASDIVFISIDAEREPHFKLDASADTPSVDKVAKTIGNVLMQSSFDATVLAGQSAREWREELQARRPAGLPEVRFHFIDVSIREIQDPAERHRFSSIPTALTLPRQDVDDLRALAAQEPQRSSDKAL